MSMIEVQIKAGLDDLSKELSDMRYEMKKRQDSFEIAARLIEEDNHYFGDRSCQTCASITGLLGRAFGCDKRRKEKGK